MDCGRLKTFFVSSVIRQKGESQNGCFKKTKYAKFPEKRTFLTNWYAHVRDSARVWLIIENVKVFLGPILFLDQNKNEHFFPPDTHTYV